MKFYVINLCSFFKEKINRNLCSFLEMSFCIGSSVGRIPIFVPEVIGYVEVVV